MNFFQKINAIWQKVGFVQRVLLIAIVLTFVIAGGLLVRWARRPDMRMLYHELSPEEASKIVEKINEKGVAYELRNGGRSVYVPKEQVYQLRLDMAREGLPVGEQGGYRIFDKEKIGVSPFVQNVNLKRALQDELAKSIQMIDGVAHARVHIVSSEQTLFSSEDSKTTASVVVRLRPGYRLSGLNIAAITHLVAGSVEGLKPESVTVIDSQGRLLSSDSDQTIASGAGTVADYRERVEQRLAEKVEDMLTTVLGPGRATVRVSAVIDMNSVSVVKETYEPKGVTSKEEIKEKTKTESSGALAGGEPAVPAGKETDNTTVTEFVIGKTVKQEVVLPGEIKSLSVAVAVDLSPADVNEESAEEQASKIMELSDVEQLVRNALGLTETDTLTVVEAKFYRPAQPLLEEEPSNWPRYIAIARHGSLGIMAICALLVLRIFSKARKKAASAVAVEQLPEGQGAVGFLPAGGESSEPLVLRKQIAGALQNNPEQVKRLFSTWLQEKE